MPHRFFPAGFTILVLICLATESFAQFDSLGIKTPWNKGSITFHDQSIVNGEIQFNDKLGLIRFRQNIAEEGVIVTEMRILAMQLYDSAAACKRRFMCFGNPALLYEVLREFEHFALLSTVDRVDIAVRTTYNAYAPPSQTKVGYEQFEYLCLLGDNNQFDVVLVVNEFERLKRSMANKKSPYLNKKKLEKHLAGDWKKFQQIVKVRKLNLKKREDFLKAFDYYGKETKP
jgi:hypothetical protein